MIGAYHPYIGKCFRFVVEAIEAEIRRRKRLEQLKDLSQFQAYMRQKYGELPGSAGEIQQMREQGDYEITNDHVTR